MINGILGGPFAWIAGKMYETSIQQGMDMELAGLKKYAESIAAGRA